MSDLSNEELSRLYDRIDAEVEENGVPKEADLSKLVDALNASVKKTDFAAILGKRKTPKKTAQKLIEEQNQSMGMVAGAPASPRGF